MVAFVAVVLAGLSGGFDDIFSAGRLIYTDGVFNFVLQDGTGFGSDTYNSIRYQPTGRSFELLSTASRLAAVIVSGGRLTKT